MKKLIKLISACLLSAVLLSFAVGCAGDPVDTLHEESGLTFLLPTVMRKGASEVYDIYYSTLIYAFGAVKLDEEFLREEDLPLDTDARAYTDFYFEINKISKDDCKVTYDEERGACLFSYSLSTDGENYVYHNCIVLRGADALWYAEFFCDYNDASSLQNSFDVYLKYVEA